MKFDALYEQIIHEAYRRQFSDSSDDVQDLLRVIYYNLQQPGDVTPPNPIPSDDYTRWEEAMHAIKMAIRDAAMEGVDLNDVWHGLRELEDKGYFSPSDADRIVDMISSIDQEVNAIELDDE